MSADKRTPISQAQSEKEIGEYWDTHSLGASWELTQEVDIEIRAQRRRRITVDPELYEHIEAQAHIRGIASETLINLWLKERLQTSS